MNEGRVLGKKWTVQHAAVALAVFGSQETALVPCCLLSLLTLLCIILPCTCLTRTADPCSIFAHPVPSLCETSLSLLLLFGQSQKGSQSRCGVCVPWQKEEEEGGEGGICSLSVAVPYSSLFWKCAKSPTDAQIELYCHMVYDISEKRRVVCRLLPRPWSALPTTRDRNRGTAAETERTTEESTMYKLRGGGELPDSSRGPCLRS